MGQPPDFSVAEVLPGAGVRPRRSTVRAVVAALRPRQWPKNVFVFAALMLTQQIGQSPQTRDAVVTFLLFCAVSSAVYLINDVVDVESDRRHPAKRHRPVAAGELQPRLAVVLACGLAAVGVVGGAAVNVLVVWIIVGYLALQVAYTFVLKQMVIVEALAIAGGFVLRVWAGGAAIGEPISPYLYLSLIFLALFQAFAKRRHELQVLAEQAGNHRQSLTEYTINLLDQLIIITATSTIVTYSLYAITTPHRPQGITANMLLLTIPFVLYAIFRYLYLVQVQGMGGSPEDILLTDRLLLLDVVAWVLLLVVILYVLPQPIV